MLNPSLAQYQHSRDRAVLNPSLYCRYRKENNLQEKLRAKFDELDLESCHQTWEWASRDELAYEYRKKHGVSTQQDRQDGQ